jgi:hypothetical protein
LRKLITSAAAGIALIGLSACDVEQTEEGEMPEVSVEGGNMPEYDVDVPEVVVGTEERTIDVPVVGVEPADAGAPGED